MSEVKFTPGPWKAYRAAAFSGYVCPEPELNGGCRICDMYGTDASANAALIAAAPDLLAECEAAVADAEKAVNPSARLPNYDQMVAAIRKARTEGGAS